MPVTPTWPSIPLAPWRPTRDTLQMYTQVVGKIRMALAPPEPQYAHVALYLTSRGLTTGPIPYQDRTFQIDFDFLAHELHLRASDGDSRVIRLEPRAVADFYREVIGALEAMRIRVEIWDKPQEVANPIPFTGDVTHASYDSQSVHRFWQALAIADTIFKEHRAPFGGRHTPVHFFWGSFDLAYARYSGRSAQPPPKSGLIMRNSMDAEEIYAGFWPGDDRFPEPAFACYAHPKPDGIAAATIRPASASWSDASGLFVLRYEDARAAADPRAAVLEFLESTYAACASLGKWPKL